MVRRLLPWWRGDDGDPHRSNIATGAGGDRRVTRRRRRTGARAADSRTSASCTRARGWRRGLEALDILKSAPPRLAWSWSGTPASPSARSSQMSRRLAVRLGVARAVTWTVAGGRGRLADPRRRDCSWGVRRRRVAPSAAAYAGWPMALPVVTRSAACRRRICATATNIAIVPPARRGGPRRAAGRGARPRQSERGRRGARKLAAVSNGRPYEERDARGLPPGASVKILGLTPSSCPSSAARSAWLWKVSAAGPPPRDVRLLTRGSPSRCTATRARRSTTRW